MNSLKVILSSFGRLAAKSLNRDYLGRSDTIRTCDLLHPMQTRYQLRYAPTELEGYLRKGLRAKAQSTLDASRLPRPKLSGCFASFRGNVLS